MDLLPPSYESAIGEPGIHNQRTAPPPLDDEITTAESVTAPIFPRPYRSNPSPNVPPNNQNSTVYLYRNKEQKCWPCIGFFIIFMFIVCALIIIIGLIRPKNQKPKFDFSQIKYYENQRNDVKVYDDKWWENHQQMTQDIKDRAKKVLEDQRNNQHLWRNIV